MAEADCGGSGGNSVPPALALPLEDVAEEEDVFVAEEPGLTPKSGDEGLSPASQLESEFLHLTIRKQVSYRIFERITPPHTICTSNLDPVVKETCIVPL
ncbi:hypothetical protein AOLI_G00288310 [Acnodon oligacanthus]